MKIKFWISYSLLLSFFVLLTPRSLWHKCEHQSHVKYSVFDNNHSDVHLDIKKCFTCDFDLGFIDKPGSILSFFQKNQFLSFESYLSDEFKSEEFSLFSKRGPPTI